MYEPKAVDTITSNGKHILIYDYLEYDFLIKLANDLVVGVNPKEDQTDYLIPDDNDVYDVIFSANTNKPTAKAANLVLDVKNSAYSNSYKNGIKKDCFHNMKSEMDFLEVHYYLKNHLDR